VQIRQFDENAWYVNNIITVHRWLTPENVRRMDEAIRSISSVDVLPPGTSPVKGAHNFNNSTDRSKTFLLDVDSTNLNGKLFDPNLLPKTGDFKLTLTKGGFSGDLPAQSSSKDVIKLQFLNDGSKQDVAMIEEVSNERGEMETIAGSARGILSGVVNNYIHTRGGDDEIIGSAGVDYIRAGTGDDIIDGGAGNDVVRSGTGNDRITLGAGADKLLITRDQLAGKDTLLDFSAEDSLVLSDGISVLAALGSNTLKVGLANGFFQELVLAGTSLLTWNPAMVTTV
jgi:Ca2+-binding RTX toxin-like protein